MSREGGGKDRTNAGWELAHSRLAFGLSGSDKEEQESFPISIDFDSFVFQKFIFASLPLNPPTGVNQTNWRKIMEKAIESDIIITNVVNDEVDEVVINEVAINEVSVVDVPVHVSESVVVDGNVVRNVAVVEVDQVQGEIR
jgi:hypothetical protein